MENNNGLNLDENLEKNVGLFNADSKGMKKERTHSKFDEYLFAGGQLKVMNVESDYKSVLSRLGSAMILSLAIIFMFNILDGYFFSKILVIDMSTTFGYALFWIKNTVIMYLPITLILVLLFKSERRSFIDNSKTDGFSKVLLIPLFFATYFVNTVGASVVSIATEFLTEKEAGSIFESVAPNSLFSNIIFILAVVIIAPIFEEFIFRNLMLKPLLRFGSGAAIVVSAAAFGLFHMNINQFLYAFLSGIILGFVAVKYGSFLYSVIIHMLINSFEIVLSNFNELVLSGYFDNGDRISLMLTFALLIIGAGSLLYLIFTGKLKLKNEWVDVKSSRKATIILSRFPIVAGLLLYVAVMIVNSVLT